MKNKIIEINGKKYKRITVNETPLWERELDEGWFSDLSAKAKQAYMKKNPNSKYAKGVKSGEKEAPETAKQKKKRQEKEFYKAQNKKVADIFKRSRKRSKK